MNVNRRFFVLFVLGAWAASFAQADARPRVPKHPTNAAHHLGQPHHPPGTANVRANASLGAPVSGRNAIGLATPPAGVAASAGGKGPSAGASAVVVNPNSIGVRAGIRALPPSVPTGVAKIGPAASPASGIRAVVTPPAPHAQVGTISGTGMARPGSAPATLGGPAKIAGGIGGPAMKKK